MVNAPSSEEYERILLKLDSIVTDKARAILKMHYGLPDHAGTTLEIARAAGVTDQIVVHSTYANLAKRFCRKLGIEPDLRPDDSARWWSVWSVGYNSPRGFVWQLHPKVVLALERLGWVDQPHYFSPDEVGVPVAVLTEGAVRQVWVNAYERNPEARRRCIEHYGAQCVACGFDFGKAYGREADGFIHVHHIRKIADIAKEYIIDPVADLRPVCANCHAVIHLGNGCRSIDELRAMLSGVLREYAHFRRELI